MRTLVDIPAAPLRAALEKSGWIVVAVDEPNVWWCRERWHLQSGFRPRKREAFLSFLVDPEHGLERPKVWAVKASPAPAARWQADPGEHMLPFARGWRNQIPEMIGYLEGLRKQGET